MSKRVFHPDLRRARFLPRSPVTKRTYRLIRRLGARTASRPPVGGKIRQVNSDVSVRLFPAPGAESASPAVLWLHGGGYVIGDAALGDAHCLEMSIRLGVVTAAVEYRLAPDHPFPAPLEDCYAALQWLAEQPEVDASRIVIKGESAGAGLGAALALLAKERGGVQPMYQMLSYPMLDDRTTARDDIDPASMRMWGQKSNRFGWDSYLGPAAADVPPLAAPARYDDVAGAAPAWIGVGTNDLFHDEDVAYARRLQAAGVPCELHVVTGAYHGFDFTEQRAGLSRAYREAQFTALERALRSAD